MMKTRCLGIFGLALVTACGPGHPTESTGTTSGSGGPTVAATNHTFTGGMSTASGPATTHPGETGAPTTGVTAVDPTTPSSGASETSTTDADVTGATEADATGTTEADATSTWTTGIVPCEDTVGGPVEIEGYPADVPDCDDPQAEWYKAHPDCRVDCSTITDIHGEGPLAGMPVVTQISFGVAYSPCWSGLGLYVIRLGSLVKPQLDLYPALECGLDPWLGDHPIQGQLPNDTPFEVTLTIESYAGDWMSEDPSEPPRLLGSFSGDLVGTFEAIHCGGLDYTTNC